MNQSTDPAYLRRQADEHRAMELEHQADMLGDAADEIDRLRTENKRLRAELVYIVDYFQGGIRPADLNAWWHRSCGVLGNKKIGAPARGRGEGGRDDTYDENDMAMQVQPER